METQHSFVNTVTIKENPTYPIINENQFHVINKKLFSTYLLIFNYESIHTICKIHM